MPAPRPATPPPRSPRRPWREALPGLSLAVLTAASVVAGYFLVGPLLGEKKRVDPDTALVEPRVPPGVEEPLPPEPTVVVAPPPSEPAAPPPAPVSPMAPQAAPEPRPGTPPPVPPPPAPPTPPPAPPAEPSPPPPAPAPPPAPVPPPAPTPPPAPVPPPAPEGPPPAVRLSGDVQPIPADPSAALASRARAAGTASQEGADIGYVLDLARRHGGSGGGGRAATVTRALRTNAWWYSHRDAPPRRTLVVDSDGIIYTYRRGHGFAVNPVATTGRWRGLNDDVPAPKLAEALLPLGVERRAAGRRYLAWEYFDVGDAPGVVRPGVSGMAQARVAELMATAYRRTGDSRFAAASRRALIAFTVPVDAGGVRSMVAYPPGRAPSPWYVERAYPGDNPWKGAALNGFMVSVLNLRGTAAELGSGALEHAAGAGAGAALEAQAGAALARALADGGARTLVRYLPLHDSGTWSYYGLLTPGRPWRTYLADLNYHCYHVALLRQLALRYPEHPFGDTADAWQADVARAGKVCPPR